MSVNVTTILEMAGLVKYHSDLYYNQAAPEITDAEFDGMVSELKGMVEEMKRTCPGSPDLAEAEEVLAGVGSIPSYGKKVAHSQVMGSLDKETEVKAVVEWAKKYSAKGEMVVVTPKIDGTSLRINYGAGKMEEAATRGDGTIGQDVTDNVARIKSISKTLKSGVTVEVRGEVYMKKSTFTRLAQSGERLFANPRNAAAGSLMAKDPEVTGRRDLDFFVHDVIVPGMTFKTQGQKDKWIETNLPELERVPSCEVQAELLSAVVKEWEHDRPNLDYMIDGLVVALESVEDQEEAGWNGKRPRGKMAFKFAPEQQKAKVLVVDWQVGRTGKLTPMCRIEPTLIDGSTVSNLTLHNAAMLVELDVAEGDVVLIEKAGDIIPQVVRVVERKKGRAMTARPEICPSCGALVEPDERKVNLWCKGLTCPAKLEGRVLHYIKSLDILGVGDGIVSGLCQAGYVKDVPDLYYMTMDQVKEVTGGSRAAEKVMKAILEKSSIPLATFLDALGIDGLGTSTSKLVAKKFKTLKAVLKLAEGKASTWGDVELTAIEGIGELTAKKILEGLSAMGPMVEKLLKAIEVEDVVDSSGPLTGMSFCLTGAMSKPRKEIERAIEAAGGEARSSVGKGLTYLVQADASSTSSKSEKAKKCGTKILGEDELWRMIG